MLQPFVQQHAIGQACQGVVQCHVARTIGEFQDVPDVLAEGIPVEGFEKERRGAGHERVLEPATGLVGRQDDDWDVLERGLRADLPDELDPVDIRHLEIDDGQIDDARRRQVRDGTLAVLGLHHFGELGDFSCNDRPRKRVVVYNEDLWPSHHSSKSPEKLSP